MPTETTLLPERYRDPRLVARGGMGEVYSATDTRLGRTVAIKLLDPRQATDETVRARFMREAHAAARLSGESGIVTIYDVGEWNGRPFIVMEHLHGGSLQDLLRREGAQPPARVLRWLGQTARALDHAHEHGVVHRDVKPANLLLDREDRVHVADFGVASAAGLASLTQTGTIVGTAGYLSPEQAEGRDATPASDRYSLAVVAWELLTGSRPFARESATAEAAAHVTATVPAISRSAPGIPRTADSVFERALAKDPSRRFGSCAELVAALGDAFAADAPPTRILAAPPRRRRPAPLLLPLALLLLLAAGALGAFLAARGGGSARDAATGSTHAPTTAASTATTAASTTAPTTTAAAPSAAQLAQEGYAKLQAGDPAAALPLLEQAARLFRGSGSTAAAYNDYNLAVALAETSGCSGQVVQLLDASQTIQGPRPQIDQLLQRCQGPPAPDHGPGPGHGHGPGPGHGGPGHGGGDH